MRREEIAYDLAHPDRRRLIYADWSSRFVEQLIHLESRHEAV